MKKFCLIFFLISYSSCIPAYLPKYTKIKADSPLLESRLEKMIRKKTIVILKSKALFEEKSLGHQYLFGIIPFTAIYLSESSDILVSKVLEDILSSYTYNTISCDAAELEAIAKNQEINLIIQGQIEDLSVSGFDAIFFRYLSVSGNLELKAFKKIKDWQNNQTNYQQKYPLDKSMYKLTAHLSQLNLLLEKSLRDNVIKFISELTF